MSSESVIADRPAEYPIHTIYFYYLYYPRGNPQADPLLKVYYQHDRTTPIETEDALKDLVEMLAWNARTRDFVPPPCGNSFSSVPWRKRAYIVVMLDDPHHQFSDPSQVSIDFVDYPEEVNHSFFNARILELDGGRQARNVFHCMNFMKHRQDRDLQHGEVERFDFTIRPPGNRALIYLDDGGTNQGGPIPPLS